MELFKYIMVGVKKEMILQREKAKEQKELRAQTGTIFKPKQITYKQTP